MQLSSKKIQKGGAFLVSKTDNQDVYIPEDKSEEAVMIQETIKQFVAKEILPNLETVESQEGIQYSKKLLKQCGELGLLGLEVSETYNGADLSFKDTLHFVEEICKSYSFSGAIGVQTSIGIAPILLYGTDYLKEKYLPRMMDGSLISSFCLTEPDAGSDANSGKTKAIIDEANQEYIISGQKAWISNAGISDLFIVFAKIEDDKNLSAFVIEKNFGGITIGAEEKKMGLSGWSTCQLFLDQVKVPFNQLLGKRNEGFKIALNTLNTGRIKLGASCIGIGKLTLNYAVAYANQRIQFKKPISAFGAIQDKLAKMTASIYSLESVIFRIAHDIDVYRNHLSDNGSDFTKAKTEALKEYSIECAIAKIYGSEIQDFIVDEGVQIYGGMGYSAEAPMERLYRSARISRIFEGTNEINRLLIVKEFLKKGMKGDLDIFSSFMQVTNEIATPATSYPDDTIEYGNTIVSNLKSLTILVAGTAAQKYMQQLEEEQELVMHISDMLLNVYVLESTLLRIEKQISEGKATISSISTSILETTIYDTVSNMKQLASNIIYALPSENDATIIKTAAEKYLQLKHKNIKEERRKIAIHLSTEGKYTWG